MIKFIIEVAEGIAIEMEGNVMKVVEGNVIETKGNGIKVAEGIMINVAKGIVIKSTATEPLLPHLVGPNHSTAQNSELDLGCRVDD